MDVNRVVLDVRLDRWHGLFSPLNKGENKMAEDEGLEPTRPKSPVFKTGALPIMLILRRIGRNYSIRFRPEFFPVTNVSAVIRRSGICPLARRVLRAGWV